MGLQDCSETLRQPMHSLDSQRHQYGRWAMRSHEEPKPSTGLVLWFLWSPLSPHSKASWPLPTRPTRPTRPMWPATAATRPICGRAWRRRRPRVSWSWALEKRGWWVWWQPNFSDVNAPWLRTVLKPHFIFLFKFSVQVMGIELNPLFPRLSHWPPGGCPSSSAQHRLQYRLIPGLHGTCYGLRVGHKHRIATGGSNPRCRLPLRHGLQWQKDTQSIA